jgi:hypothetical protein
MHMVKPVRVLWTLGLAAVLLLPVARVASATTQDVSIERSGSIIVFPKVLWTGTCVGGTNDGAPCTTDGACTGGGGSCNLRDTVIQIANTSNNMVHARCFYVNAAPVNPSYPPGPGNPAQCNETDFDIWLTKQQPTMWVASLGRSGSAYLIPGISALSDQVLMLGYDSGFPPGLIPPVTQGFIGELKCVQVDASDAPLRANALKGEATIRDVFGDISEYNAVAFQGNPDMSVSSNPDDSNDLVLDYTANSAQVDAGEYSACPDTLLLNHLAQGASDPVLDQLCTGSCSPEPLRTELTLVPCSENLENQLPGKVTVQFVVYNEFEQAFSTSTTVTCYLNLPLDQIGAPGNNPFTFTVLGTLGAYARINPNPGNGGVIGVAEEFRSVSYDSAPPLPAAAIFSLHTEGNRFDAATDGKGGSVQGATDHIIIPQP